MIVVKELENFKKRISYIEKDEVSFIEIEETIDIINIIDVFTKEEYRRKGYSKKLFNYLFELNKDKNIKYMLEVRVDNKSAIKLYENLGFKIIHTRKNYYKDTDAYIMEVKI